MVPGDRVVKRGFNHLGTVTKLVKRWVWVDWDDGRLMKERPLICDIGELANAQR